jgi:hypothetical protein
MPDGRVVISDFGLAVLMERDTTSITESGRSLGTRVYMAPEQQQDGKHVDHRADIYSLGMILYELTSGRHPHHMLMGEWDGIDSGIKFVIQKATASKPEQRYQTVEELLAEYDLVTGVTPGLEDVSETATKIIEKARSGVPIKDKEIAELMRCLRVDEDNQELFQDVVPKMSGDILGQLDNAELTWLIENYDRHVEGNLDWDYCDKVGRVARRAWNISTNNDAKVKLFARVLDLGYSHNRYSCQDIAVELAEATSGDPAMMLAVRDAMKANKRAVNHYHPKFIASSKLPPMLKKVVRDIVEDLKPKKQDDSDSGISL